MSEKYVFFLDFTKEKGAVVVCGILEKLQGLDAEALLQQYDIDMTPPIDLTKLLRSIGIKSYPIDFSSVEKVAGYENGEIIGATLSKGQELRIMYANNIGTNRSRFTVAHELAHCCLHSKELQIRNLMFRKDEKLTGEVSADDEEANIFAGQLLIPKKVLKTYIEKLITPTIEALAKIFQVSENVMKKRLEYLEIRVCEDGVIKSTEN